MADDPQYPGGEDPLFDPFDSKTEDDPFVEDHFGARPISQGRRMENVPDATAILILGIVSILGGFCYGVVGIIVAVIAPVMANKSETKYNLDPERYTVNSHSNLRAGKICAIIGLVLSIILTVFFVVMVMSVSDGEWRRF
ncbi:MAG: CCC motif membrane protein [Bacteroidota bacterium]